METAAGMAGSKRRSDERAPDAPEARGQGAPKGSRADARERRDIDAETARLQTLRRKQAGYQSVLARPQNADVFSTSVFLNELIARRAVSWTVVFRDLEKTLPANMRLEGLRLPQVSGQDSTGTNRVMLDMVVATTQPETFIELLKRLQQSPLFGDAQVLGQQPPTQNDPLFKFRVTVAYAQKL